MKNLIGILNISIYYILNTKHKNVNFFCDKNISLFNYCNFNWHITNKWKITLIKPINITIKYTKANKTILSQLFIYAIVFIIY